MFLPLSKMERREGFLWLIKPVFRCDDWTPEGAHKGGGGAAADFQLQPGNASGKSHTIKSKSL